MSVRIKNILKGITALQKYVIKILIPCIFIILAGCAGRQPVRIPPDDVSEPESPSPLIRDEGETSYPPEPEEPVRRPTPRDQASLNLMDKAMVFLDENRPDESIRTLEKAVTISPGRGENYYYLAEAWLMKGNYSQAKEYNSLAAIYLKDDARWMDRVEEQKIRIEEE